MTLSSDEDSVSIFKDAKLRPGIYKIQNIVSKTYVEIREYPKELCCRPSGTSLEGKGRVGSHPHLTRRTLFTVTFSGNSSL